MAKNKRKRRRRKSQNTSPPSQVSPPSTRDSITTVVEEENEPIDESPTQTKDSDSSTHDQSPENEKDVSPPTITTPHKAASSGGKPDKIAEQLLAIAEQERDKFQKELADQKEAHERLQQQYTEIKQERDTAIERIAVLEAEQKSLQEKINLYKADQTELTRLRDESAGYQANLNELAHSRTTIQNLESSQERLQKLLAEEQGKRDKLIQKQEVLSRQEQRIVDLQVQLDEISTSWQPERVKELELVERALRRQVTYLEGQVDEYAQRVEELEAKLDQFNETEFESLRELSADLHRQLEAQDEELRKYRLHKAELAKYKNLLRRAAELEQKNTQLEETNISLQQQMSEFQIQLSQQEAYKALLEKARLENNTLKLEIEVLNEAEERRQQRGDRAFEALQELTSHPEYSQPVRTKLWPGDDQVVNTVRDVADKNGFHFYLYQIRAFLAAIRSSRLVILRGFSGLGKTSLPILFARAIGAHCEVIPVQPSWRSKVDLLGFYNHFEQRFLPTQFTKALLKAQLPAFKNRLFFIVLDEMNLARIEYYFSDFNVKLEDPNNPAVELFEHASVTSGFLDKKLGQYVHNGNEILIPPNVTFIGTINDDETTFAISDKIYDRSQVIDFFKVREQTGHGVLPEGNKSSSRLSFDGYQSTGQNAKSSGLTFSEVDDFLNRINKELRDMFYLSLSYRPRRQIRDFIHAYTLSGGDKSEALDLQIISKIIPKIRYSHRADFEEQLTEFEDKIEKEWPYQDQDKTPRMTKERLELLKKQG